MSLSAKSTCETRQPSAEGNTLPGLEHLNFDDEAVGTVARDIPIPQLLVQDEEVEMLLPTIPLPQVPQVATRSRLQYNTHVS